MTNKQIARELVKVAQKLIAVRFEVGDWILQEANGIYGLVVGIQKNGSPKAVTYSEEFHRKPKLNKVVRNWYPTPTKINESQVPDKIRQKIKGVAPRFTASKKIIAMDEWMDSVLKSRVKQLALYAKDEADVTSVKGNRIEMVFRSVPVIVEVMYFGYLGEEEQIDGISIAVRDARTKRPVTLPVEVEPDATPKEMWKALLRMLRVRIGSSKAVGTVTRASKKIIGTVKTILGYSSGGYSYDEMKKLAKRKRKDFNWKNWHIAYGTRTEKFHLIDEADRDWEKFDMSVDDFLKTRSEQQAVSILTRARLI